MDALSMLKDDHRTVERLFKRFEQAGERAYAEKRKVADRIIEELAKHAAVEEQVLYPAVRATVPGVHEIVLESLEEHHIVKWVLSELDGMDASDERFDAKMTVLIENVRHHVEEEERELFPKVRDELNRNALAELGQSMGTARSLAPTHPHPQSPDTPPGNIVAGLTAGLVDRIGDAVSGLAQGSVTAIQDLIATMRGQQRRSAAPTGSKLARDRAETVRTGASSLTDDAIAAAEHGKRTAMAARDGAKQTALSAVDGVKETVRAAKSAATSAATSARNSSSRAATTAKRASTTTRRRAAPSARKTAKPSTRASKRTRQTASSS